MNIFSPQSADMCLVVILSSDIAHKELKASPLNPKVDIPSKSENSLNFDV